MTYAVLFGLDLTEEFPVLWLRLKRAINKGAKVVFIGHYAPEIAKHLHKVILHPPGNELNTLNSQKDFLHSLAVEGKNGAFFVGRQYLASSNRRNILCELLKLRQDTPNLTLNLLEGTGNSLGARYAGMHPELLSGGQFSESPGFNTLQVLENAAENAWDILYVVGANPAIAYPSDLWKQARSKIDFLVVHDLFLTETASQADVVLPTLSYLEKQGTFLNLGKRIQKIHPGKEIPENLCSDGEIFVQIAQKLKSFLDIDTHFLEALHNASVSHEFSNKIELSEENASSSLNETKCTQPLPRAYLIKARACNTTLIYYK